MSDLFVDSWGSGTPVVLVHGSLAIGAEEWQSQRPLAGEGFRLMVLDRRGYGRSPRLRGRTSYVMPTTSPTSWAMVPTSWVIPMVASAFCSPPPAVSIRLYR